MISHNVTLISNTIQFLNDEEDRLDGVGAEMAIDILNRAIMNAPKASGALVRSGKITRLESGKFAVTFGNNAVRYAYRRHFENKKNPQTLLYLEKAGESVARGNVQKYFR